MDADALSVDAVFGTVYANRGGRLNRDLRLHPASAIQHGHSAVFDMALIARLQNELISRTASTSSSRTSPCTL